MFMSQGLEGVVAAETAISMVDGQRGELIIRGYAVEELAPNATFEETVGILGVGEFLDGERELSPIAYDVLRAAAQRNDDPMNALRAAAGIGGAPLTTFPTIVAAYFRLIHKQEPIAPRVDLLHASNYLYMLDGKVPSPERVRALETYLNTVVDHGLNASTFTARVITSTGSDLVSAIVGAVGALKGPLHGGAPEPALDMVFEIGDASRAEEVLRRKIESGERLMGFGHRVYKVRDPRADVLAVAAERMFTRGGDMALYELARSVESVALRLLEEYKPGRRWQTKVGSYTALLWHAIGLEGLFSLPTFATSAGPGWPAHALEQRG